MSAVVMAQCTYEDGAIYNDTYNHFPARNIHSYNEKRIEVQIGEKDKKYGLIDTNGATVVGPIYDSIVSYSGMYIHTFKVLKDKKWGTVTEHGEVMIPIIFDDIQSFELTDYYSCLHRRNLLLVSRDGNQGVYTSTGELFIEVKYDYIQKSLDDLSCPHLLQSREVKKDGKYGIVNQKGKEILPCEYDVITQFDNKYHDNRFAVYKNGKYGLLDENGRQIIDCKYDEIMSTGNDFKELYIVKEKGLYGVIDIKDSFIIHPQFKSYQFVEGFSPSGHDIIFKEGGYGQALPAPMSHCFMNYQGIFLFRKSGKWGFLNSVTNKFVPNKYQMIYGNYGDYLAYRKDDKYGILRIDGKEITAPIFQAKPDGYDLNQHGIACFKQGGKYGILDSSGVIKIAAKYARPVTILGTYSTGQKYYIEFEDRGKKVVISRQGDELLRGNYKSIEKMEDVNLLVVSNLDNKKALMTRQGEFITPFEYDHFEKCKQNDHWLKSSYIMARTDGEEGLLDTTGKVLLETKHDYISQISDELFTFKDSTSTTTFDIKKGFSKIDLPYIQHFNGQVATYYDDGIYKIKDLNNKDLYTQASKFKLLPNGFLAYQENAKWGVLNPDGSPLIMPIYDKIKYYDGDKGIVKLNGSYGVIDSNENFINEHRYEKVKYIYDKKISARQNGKYGIVDFDGNVLMPFKMECPIDIQSAYEIPNYYFWCKLFPYHIDSDLRIEHSYTPHPDKLIKQFDEGIIAVEYYLYKGDTIYKIKKDRLYGLANAKGEIILEPLYDEFITQIGFYHRPSNYHVTSKFIFCRIENGFSILNLDTPEEFEQNTYDGWRAPFPNNVVIYEDDQWFELNDTGRLGEKVNY